MELVCAARMLDLSASDWTAGISDLGVRVKVRAGLEGLATLGALDICHLIAS